MFGGILAQAYSITNPHLGLYYVCSATVCFTIFQENRFSTCDVCAAIREARERTLNPEVRKWIGQLMEKHMQLQR